MTSSMEPTIRWRRVWIYQGSN